VLAEPLGEGFTYTSDGLGRLLTQADALNETTT
jgi:hypothetical protein